MEVKKESINELFKRKEMLVDLENEKNPSFDEVRKMVAEKEKIGEECVDVKNVMGGFGKSNFISEVYVYDSGKDLENMKKLEMTKKQRKEGAKVEEGAGGSGSEGSEETKTEESSKEEEKSAEENKEEVKEGE